MSQQVLLKWNVLVDASAFKNWLNMFVKPRFVPSEKSTAYQQFKRRPGQLWKKGIETTGAPKHNTADEHGPSHNNNG